MTTSFTRVMALAAGLAAAALAGCNSDSGGAGANPPADAGAVVADGGVGPATDAVARVRLIDWVDDLVSNYTAGGRPPDTVEDKVDIIIDTDDPAAFDKVLATTPP